MAPTQATSQQVAADMRATSDRALASFGYTGSTASPAPAPVQISTGSQDVAEVVPTVAKESPPSRLEQPATRLSHLAPPSASSTKNLPSVRLARSYPELASRLVHLRFDDFPDDAEAQARVREGFAEAWLWHRHFFWSGYYTRFAGRIGKIYVALTAVLVPVAVGLQGSFGSTDAETLAADEVLKYLTMAISISGTIVGTVDKVVKWMERGIKMEICAQKMEKTLTDYLALSGPDFDPYYAPPEEVEEAKPLVPAYTIPDLSDVPVAVLEAHVVHMRAAEAAQQQEVERAEAEKARIAKSHVLQFRKFAGKMNELLIKARMNELGVFGVEHNEGLSAASNLPANGAAGIMPA